MEGQNINWEIIQTIIGIVVGIIAAIWAFFSYSNNNYNKRNNTLLISIEAVVKDLQAQYEENRLEDQRQQGMIDKHDEQLKDHEKRLRDLERRK